MPKEFIVAIELGSSKITGIAGKKDLVVIAIYKNIYVLKEEIENSKVVY